MWRLEEVMENLKQKRKKNKRKSSSICLCSLKVVLLFLFSPPFPLRVLFVLTWKRIPCFILKLAPAPVGVQIALDSACDVCIFSLIEGTEVEYKIKTAQIGQLSALYNFPSLQVYTLREKLQECWKRKPPTKNPIKKSNMISLMSIKEKKEPIKNTKLCQPFTWLMSLSSRTRHYSAVNGNRLYTPIKWMIALAPTVQGFFFFFFLFVQKKKKQKERKKNHKKTFF